MKSFSLNFILDRLDFCFDLNYDAVVQTIVQDVNFLPA